MGSYKKLGLLLLFVMALFSFSYVYNEKQAKEENSNESFQGIVLQDMVGKP